MGMFDEFVGGQASTEEQRPSAPSTRPVNMFEEYTGGAPPAPAPQGPIGNRVFGELKPTEFSYTQRLKQAAQAGLEYLGANRGAAQHLGGAAVNIGGMTPMGSVLSAAELTRDLPQGNYGAAALDVVGMAPGALAAKRAIQGVPKVATAATPETKELLDTARAAYRRVGNAPVDYTPGAMQDVVAGSKYVLEHPSVGGFSPEKAPLVHSTLDRFNAMGERRAAEGRPISAVDFDALRSQLRGLPGADGVAGRHAVSVLDTYMYHPPPGAVVRGTASDLDTIRRDLEMARGNYRAGKTAETVEEAIDRAGTKAAMAHSGLNVDNATRQRLGAFVTTNAGEKALFGATDAERAALEAVAKGDWTTNKLRRYGNLLGGGGGLGQTFTSGLGGSVGAGTAHMMGLDPTSTMVAAGGGAAVPFMAGTAMRTAANERTVRAAEEAARMIRQNSPLYAAREAVSQPIADPRTIARDVIAYSLIPQIRDEGQDWWNQAHVPYANR